MTSATRKVLIVGASGLVGSATATAFAQSGWQVLTASRRTPDWIDGAFQHFSLDLDDPDSILPVIAQHPDLTHLVYTAVFELPGLVAGWSDPSQIARNGDWFDQLLTRLLDQTALTHVTLLQGTKAYGASVQPMRVPAREDQPRVEHPNFYWLQEDRLKKASEASGLTFTILRPQLIVGPNQGVVMNLPPVIGAYAALRRAEGLPFSFPGGADWVWEAVDVRLVANACVWAASHPNAVNQTFNLTNGEVFLWRDLWPALADVLDIDTGPDEPLDLATYFSDRIDTWQSLAATHGLIDPNLMRLLGESHHYANLCFAYGAIASPPPALVSTIKIKQAGFTETHNTEVSFCHWLSVLRDRRFIP